MASDISLPANPASRARLEVAMALLAVYVVWGSTYLAIRIGVQRLPLFLFGGSRFLIAGAILFLILILRGTKLPTRKEWGGSAIVGTLLLVFSNGGVLYAERTVASGLTALTLATTPLWAAIFASLFGTRPVLREWIGLMIGFAGIILLNLDHGLRASHAGALALALASVCWALGTVWSGRLTLPAGLMASATQMLTAGVVLLAISLCRGESWHIPVNGPAFWSLIYLIVFGSLIGYSAYSFLVRTVRTALATTNAYINPVVAVALGSGFAGEKITAVEAIAAVIILTGVAIVMTARRASTSAIPSK